MRGYDVTFAVWKRVDWDWPWRGRHILKVQGSAPTKTSHVESSKFTTSALKGMDVVMRLFGGGGGGGGGGPKWRYSFMAESLIH